MTKYKWFWEKVVKINSLKVDCFTHLINIEIVQGKSEKGSSDHNWRVLDFDNDPFSINLPSRKLPLQYCEVLKSVNNTFMLH